MVDWAGGLSIARDVIVSVSAVTGVIIASRGLHTWRSELKGKSEYQLAKDMLKAVYEVRENFKHIRNPAIYRYEYPEEMLNLHGHLEPDFAHDGTRHVYDERFKPMQKSFCRLEKLHIDAQVEWGPEFQDKIIKLRKCRAELLVTVQFFVKRKKPDDYNKPPKGKDDDSIIYDVGNDNPFTKEIDKAVREFEDWLRPKIKR